ncbi:translation initiation factor IF-1 3, partial [Striga asiatica]
HSFNSITIPFITIRHGILHRPAHVLVRVPARDNCKNANIQSRYPGQEPIQRDPEAPHRVGDLIVKKLLKPDYRETVPYTVEQKLGRQPENTHRGRRPVSPEKVEPPPLDDCRHQHGEDVYGHADADSLEDGYAPLAALDSAGKGLEGVIVNCDHGDHGDGGEAENRGGREEEVVAEVAVESRALLDEESGALGKAYGEGHGREPYGDYVDDELHFLDLGHGCKSPRVWVVVVGLDYGGLVEEPFFRSIRAEEEPPTSPLVPLRNLLPLDKSRDSHPRKWREWATRGPPKAVERPPNPKNHQRKAHNNCKRDIGRSPTHVVLHVDDHGHP